MPNENIFQTKDEIKTVSLTKEKHQELITKTLVPQKS